MASPDLRPPPANHKDSEQFPGRESQPENCPRPVIGSNDETAKSTPPASGNDTEATNKRKRGTQDDGFNDNDEKISTEPTQLVHTTDNVETAGVKEVEMKDAEAIDESPDQGIKEVEMQDAEVVCNITTHIHDKENSRPEGVANKTHPDVNDYTESNLNTSESGKQDQGTKETEQPAKVDESKSNEKQSDHTDMSKSKGSGQEALGEVASLLKQAQESDAKAKLEVEVKVKKMDDGVVKENGKMKENGEIEKAVQV